MVVRFIVKHVLETQCMVCAKKKKKLEKVPAYMSLENALLVEDCPARSKISWPPRFSKCINT